VHTFSQKNKIFLNIITLLFLLYPYYYCIIIFIDLSLEDENNFLFNVYLGSNFFFFVDSMRFFFFFFPEPIVNEHPVTIYPGRSSPSRRVPSRAITGAIDRHRDIGHRNHLTNENSTSQESSDTSPSSGSPTKQINRNNTVFNKIFINSKKEFNDNKYDKNHDSDEDRFSDDSLEDTSLPPPPPPPVVPPPPTLSAPVTPSKRHSIAWEINLDDPKTMGDPLDNVLPCCTKVSRRSPIISDFQL
jgi:hypothetical protein